VYERKQKARPDDIELTMGRMRCHHALAEWEVSRVACLVHRLID
jgi:hypothetical protein